MVWGMAEGPGGCRLQSYIALHVHFTEGKMTNRDTHLFVCWLCSILPRKVGVLTFPAEKATRWKSLLKRLLCGLDSLAKHPRYYFFLIFIAWQFKKMVIVIQ